MNQSVIHHFVLRQQKYQMISLLKDVKLPVLGQQGWNTRILSAFPLTFMASSLLIFSTSTACIQPFTQTQSTGIIHNILKLKYFSNLSTKLVWCLISYLTCCSICFFSLDKHHLVLFTFIWSATAKIIVACFECYPILWSINNRKREARSNIKCSSAFKVFTAFHF